MEAIKFPARLPFEMRQLDQRPPDDRGDNKPSIHRGAHSGEDCRFEARRRDYSHDVPSLTAIKVTDSGCARRNNGAGAGVAARRSGPDDARSELREGKLTILN